MSGLIHTVDCSHSSVTRSPVSHVKAALTIPACEENITLAMMPVTAGATRSGKRNTTRKKPFPTRTYSLIRYARKKASAIVTTVEPIHT